MLASWYSIKELQTLNNHDDLSSEELITWATFLETGGEISPLSLVGGFEPSENHEEIILEKIELYKRKEAPIARFFLFD